MSKPHSGQLIRSNPLTRRGLILMVPRPCRRSVSILQCPLVPSRARLSYNSGEAKCRPITFPYSPGVIRYNASCFGCRPSGWAAMQRGVQRSDLYDHAGSTTATIGDHDELPAKPDGERCLFGDAGGKWGDAAA
jgi:hypothetical protein